MMRGWRRPFAVLAFVALATPLAAGLLWPDGPAAVLKEGRRLAGAPALPATASDWLALPDAFDAYLKDHFGLRQALIRAHHELTKPMLGMGEGGVLIGRDGRMFYLGEEAVRQSAGLIVRDQRILDTVALIAAMDQDLAERGVRLIVAAPPNAATVYQDDLPGWAQKSGRKTEYDLYLEELASRGVRAVDLRPAMAEARAQGTAYYRHDTHWTARGALAAFNAIVEADGRPDWRLDPDLVLGPGSIRKGGDLARLLGVEDAVAETAEDLKLSGGKKELLTPQWWEDFVETSDRPGPTVMIIGDSFTGAHFAQMLLQHAGRVVWLDHQHCGFDWKAIDRFRPDEVWWMPNERFLLCGPGVRPLDFAG